jgi:RNA polymerase sigma factor (sigma-70 family)
MPRIPIKSERKSTPSLKNSNGDSLRQKCLKKLKSILKISLIQYRPTLYSNTQESVGVFCAFSKGRVWSSSKVEYWFAISSDSKKFLEQFKSTYLAFVCGSDTLMVSFNEIKKDASSLDAHGRLHVHIFKSKGKFILSSTGKELPHLVCPAIKKNNTLSKLDPQGVKDFWVFYPQHKKDIDDILTAQIYKIVSYLSFSDKQDLRQDVLMRLWRCHILSTFNPALASFNTFFTNCIQGYIRNWVTNKKKKQACCWLGGHNEQVYVHALNGINPDMEIPDDLNQDVDYENEYNNHERVESLRRTTPESLQGVLNLLYVGLTKKEIAENLEVSNSNVSVITGKIKRLNLKKQTKVGMPC